MQVGMQQNDIYQLQIEDYTVACWTFLCEREEMNSSHPGFDKDNFIPHEEIATVTLSWISLGRRVICEYCLLSDRVPITEQKLWLQNGSINVFKGCSIS